MTPDSDRDMDRLLGAVLPGTLAPASAECLDAERLAAWSEGALDSEAARSVETHLAGCARCQALAAVFARTEPAPAASVSPGVVIPMRRRWSMGWIAPLAAAAAAATLWIVWPGRQIGPASESTIATAPASPGTPAPTQTMARAEENKQKAAETGPPAAGFAEPKNQARTQAPADADASRLDQLKKDATARRDRDAAVNPTAAPAEAPKAAGALAAPATSTGAPPPAPAAPPPPPAAPASTAQTPAARPAQAAPPFAQTGQAGAARPASPPLGAMNEAVSVARRELQARDSAAAAKLEATVPPVIEIVTVQAQVLDAISEVNTRQVAGGVAGRGGGGGGRGGGARAAPPAPPPAAAPAVAPRWRILEGTRVERSTDNGATWLPLGIDLPARLTGGASPAPSVCWLIGERGLVLLSTNGLNFERITFPAAVNLTGIRATSAESAAIATTDGRTFITSDGGRSWRLQGFPAGSF